MSATVNIKLTPMRLLSRIDNKPYYEQITIMVSDYPMAIVHIDNFWTKDSNDIYDDLKAGKEVIGIMTIEKKPLPNFHPSPDAHLEAEYEDRVSGNEEG